MRKYFFEGLTVLLFGGALAFFYQCLKLFSRRDYVAGILIMFVGFGILRVGAEMARISLVERRG
jgi:hypothetical protein